MIERARPLPLVILAALLAIGLRPHLYALSLSPISRDDVIWLTRSAITDPGWREWVFRSEHFVGFRPVTALSYTLDSAIGGFEMPPYRATDLLLHLGCALLVYAVYRRLVLSLSAWGGVAASAVLLLHPVTGLVVPHLARRAYPLATLLSLLGIWVSIGVPPARSRRRLRDGRVADVRAAEKEPGRAQIVVGLLAASLLGAGALANEAAYVAFPVALLLLLLREPDLRSASRAFAPLAAVAALLVLQRLWLLGGAGGYAVERGGRWLPILASTWEGLLGLGSLRSGASALPEPLSASLVPLILGALALGTLRSPSAEARAGAAILWAWVAGLTAIYAPQGVFFPRQLYVPLAPFALLLGIALADGIRSRRPAGPLAAGLALSLALRQSPVLWGTDPVQYACWRAHDRLVRQMAEDLRDLPPKATVNAVLPYHRRPEMEALRARDPEESRFPGRQGLAWVGALRDIRFGPAVLVYADPLDPGPIGRIEDRPGGPVMVLDPGAEVASAGGGSRLEQTPEGTVIHPDPTARRDRPLFLYLHDGQRGLLVPR